MATDKLTHLQFVLTASEALSNVAVQGYAAVKKAAPQTVEQLEVKSQPLIERAAPILAPLATQAVDIGLQSLKAADAKVDQVLASENMKKFNASMTSWYEAATKLADAAIERVKSPKLIEGVTAARESLSAAFAKAREASDPDVAFKIASEAWVAFASYPAIQKVLETASPVTTAGFSAFVKLHDTLVASPTYKTLIDRAVATLNPYATYAASTSAFQYVKPVTDKVAASKVANSFVTYWTPQVVA